MLNGTKEQRDQQIVIKLSGTIDEKDDVGKLIGGLVGVHVNASEADLVINS